ncbi:nuclear transport factor 2 family protein [Hymenobacter properus]|uniref:Nuclear transport factor 2 family protein n=1 Tax=Hymenobacter properus TaxID=2791026 RepID=A0A931FJI7_9BACT|nr:nuclear transport factor 2 family protein [Hymenobacter properus]MBF9140056.1 nuclear transport factor 2 family protein [Hymenobacter properus]MBR7718863.1 nuclear transport factor 2 family protein [Microvirga sp. SRT04]
MNQPLTSLLLVGVLTAATPVAHAQKASPETAAVQQTVTAFFDGMRRGDSTMVRRTLAPGAVFHGFGGKPGQPPKLEIESINGFLKAVGTPHAEVWDERVQFEHTLVDANLASVWAPYEFYLGSKFSHCGYDSFQLVKLADGWKIAHIIDTRRKEKCK